MDAYGWIYYGIHNVFHVNYKHQGYIWMDMLWNTYGWICYGIHQGYLLVHMLCNTSGIHIGGYGIHQGYIWEDMLWNTPRAHMS